MVGLIGQAVVLAVGLVLATLPTVLITLMLATRSPAAVTRAFIGGWVAGLAVAGGVVLGLGDLVKLIGPSPAWLSYVELLLGALLVVMSVRKWRRRSRAGDVPETPAWMASLDTVTPGRALGLAFVMAAVNPKNLAIVASAATLIADTTERLGEQLVALGVFVLVGSLGVAAPGILRRVLGQRSAPLLEAANRVMTRHSTLVMAAVLLVLGLILVGNGLTGL